MKELLSSNIFSLQADLAKAALTFMNTHSSRVQQYIDANPPQPNDIRPFLMNYALSGALTTGGIILGPDYSIHVLSLKLDRIHTALPDEQPSEGLPCSITFHASVNADLLVLTPTRPSPYYGSFVYGAFQYGQAPFTAYQLPIAIVGKARANFKGGDFVEPLTIESVRVGPAPETS